MEIYLVFVKNSLGHKYIDSVWISRDGFDKRMQQLNTVFKSMEIKNTCYTMPIRLEDGKIEEKEIKENA